MGRVLVVGGLAGGDVPPEVRGKELVGLGNGNEGSLEEVSGGGSASLGLGVAVGDTGL